MGSIKINISTSALEFLRVILVPYLHPNNFVKGNKKKGTEGMMWSMEILYKHFDTKLDERDRDLCYSPA